MAKRRFRGKQAQPVSLSPLTTEQALAGLLKVKPADVKKLEAKEAKRKRGR